MSIADYHVSVVSPTGFDPATGEPIYAKKALASEETQQAILSALSGGASAAEYSHLCATVTAAGQTTIYTPTSGKCIRLRKVIILNDPNATNSAWFKVFIGGAELFRAWALSTSVRRTGAVNQPLIIELSTAANLQVTVLFEEVNP